MMTKLLPWLLLALIVCCAGFLRFVQVGESLWLDELHTAWTVADGPGEIAGRAAIGNHSPVYFSLVWAVTKVAGLSELALRLPSAIAGVALVVLAYLVVLRWTGSWSAGLLAALLACLDRNCVFYSQEARPYACVQLVGLAHIALYSSLLIAPTRIKRVGFVALGGLLFYLHYTASLLFLAELAFYAILLTRGTWRPKYGLWQLLVDFAVIALCFLPAVPHLMEIADRRSNWAMFVQQWPPSTVVQMFFLRNYLPLLLLAAWGILILVFRWWCGRSCALAESPKHRSRNMWRKLPACDATIHRKLEAYATEKSDSYFSNGANIDVRYFVLTVCWLFVPLGVAWLATERDLARLFFLRYVVVTALAPIMFAALCCAFGPRIGTSPLCAVTLLTVLMRLVCAVALIALAVQSGGMIEQYHRDGRVIGDRNQDWQSAVQMLNEEASNPRIPVFVRSGLIEADQLHNSSDRRLREYCLLPVLGIYRIERDAEKLTPLPTRWAGGLSEKDRKRVATAGEAWFLLSGTPGQVGKMKTHICRRWEARGVRATVAEHHSFGNVAALRLTVRPRAAVR